MAICANVFTQTKINDINKPLYNRLNKKLEHLCQIKHTLRSDQPNTQTTNTFYTRIINYTNIKFNKEDTKILELGLNYALESQTKHFIKDLIFDNENAIQHLDNKIQSTYHFLACRKITQIINSNMTNTLHKRQIHIVKQTHKKLTQHNLMIAKADKGRTIVITDKQLYKQKVTDFLHNHHI
jgi:hypothetical protein